MLQRKSVIAGGSTPCVLAVSRRFTATMAKHNPRESYTPAAWAAANSYYVLKLLCTVALQLCGVVQFECSI